MSQRIENAWKKFRGNLPKDTSREKLAEARAAFYAGVNELYWLIRKAIDADETPHVFMNEIESELHGFLAEITQRKGALE